MIGIIDYGMGNLFSLRKALERLEVAHEIVSQPEHLNNYSGLLLPGVGAFGDAMRYIRAISLDQAIREYVRTDRPILGICLGMQLLFSESEEHGEHKGLDLLPGRVVRFQGDFKIPHMGWNELSVRNRQHPLVKGVLEGEYAYFVHSYYVQVHDPTHLLATTDYHHDVAAIVSSGKVTGMQFHPEKSGSTGIRLLANFVQQCKEGLS
ncbi:imidazole glycerol phosphate synthase subunit HisH [Brevibacillus laterosporus]|uniref:imidazole glycerol phosphate synthase subunit HisH n=1 Tax=Brevibacillus laterosporus TaxID=1465 RepID=UPI000E6B864A|nr:imidazole glycerol phosphate synthase subunit HisH [Brevibacillus laterosporus]AYB40841.1 imidazole glycerol phosphate synthase subunit HisH [Brevibacillus laterosporus]MBM7110451.1 Imidazole glycerol phosphate synthase subunit HisH 1 [Brevibacillus laterosporus]